METARARAAERKNTSGALLCVRQILCTLMLKLLEPYGANTPYPTGAAWNSQPLAWMMRAAGAPDSAGGGIANRSETAPLFSLRPHQSSGMAAAQGLDQAPSARKTHVSSMRSHASAVSPVGLAGHR